MRGSDEIMGFAPQLQLETGTEWTIVDGAIVAPVRLNAYLSLAVTIFRTNCIDKSDGHGQPI